MRPTTLLAALLFPVLATAANCYLPTTLDQRQFTKTLRQNMTDAELLLWKHLRAHRMDGQKFRRQQPIGPYIVDFLHHGAGLVVEADGGQHNGSESICVVYIKTHQPKLNSKK